MWQRLGSFAGWLFDVKVWPFLLGLFYGMLTSGPAADPSVHFVALVGLVVLPLLVCYRRWRRVA